MQGLPEATETRSTQGLVGQALLTVDKVKQPQDKMGRNRCCNYFLLCFHIINCEVDLGHISYFPWEPKLLVLETLHVIGQ